MGRGKYVTLKDFIVFTVHLICVRVIRCGRLRWKVHVARMEEGRRTFEILTCKYTGKRALRRPKHIYEKNI